jgi:hypothetical protein
MTSLRGLEELWRQAFELNVRLYSGVGKLTLDYLKDLAKVVSTTQPMAAQSVASPGVPVADAPSAAPESASSQPVMVLEGEMGSTAVGVFLVGNSFPKEVSAMVVASPLVDDGGREGKVTFAFDPSVIRLKQGEQVLVRVNALINRSLARGVSYRGELSIPELGGTRIPVIVRRRADAERKTS